jgi:hypothetical protein
LGAEAGFTCRVTDTSAVIGRPVLSEKVISSFSLPRSSFSRV